MRGRTADVGPCASHGACAHAQHSTAHGQSGRDGGGDARAHTHLTRASPCCLQVLAAAGAVNHDELVKKASEAFGSVPDEDPSSSVRTLITKVCAPPAREKAAGGWSRRQRSGEGHELLLTGRSGG